MGQYYYVPGSFKSIYPKILTSSRVGGICLINKYYFSVIDKTTMFGSEQKNLLVYDLHPLDFSDCYPYNYYIYIYTYIYIWLRTKEIIVMLIMITITIKYNLEGFSMLLWPHKTFSCSFCFSLGTFFHYSASLTCPLLVSIFLSCPH